MHCEHQVKRQRKDLPKRTKSRFDASASCDKVSGVTMALVAFIVSVSDVGYVCVGAVFAWDRQPAIQGENAAK